MRILSPSYAAWVNFILGALRFLSALRAQGPPWGIGFGMQPAQPLRRRGRLRPAAMVMSGLLLVTKELI